uniref:Tat-binding homolog 7 n=2 Tax=Clastoptera arizonana TaxID=38151 RepID=A0A1B6EE35_9HEMI
MDIESGSMSDKGNSDYSSSKTTKVWSRELRNRHVIANNKRSLTFPNNVRSGRHVRSCRRAITSHQLYTLSQTDDEDEEFIFTAQNSRRIQHPKHHMDGRVQSVGNRSRSSVMNGHISKSSREDDENAEEGAEGIRRSTRKRKLKYENYSDSWIVGAQTLRGYPMYGSSYSDHPDIKQEGLEEEEEEEEEEDDDDDDEEENLKVPGETDELDTEDGVAPRKVVVETRKSERRRTIDKERAEEARETDQNEQSKASGLYQDMYSRVKRTRAAKQAMYVAKGRPRREVAERKQQVNTSDESDSSSEEVSRQRDRGRVEKRKYHLRQTKPTVERFQSHVDQPLRRSSRALRDVLNSVRRHRRRRSSSTSSSSSSEDQRFERKKGKNKSTKTKGRSRCLPQWKEGEKEREKVSTVGGMPEASGRLADVDPISLDTSIRFADVGGLQAHVRCLQELVVFPMMYAEVFRKYHVKPPKGVLFHGPPGTGKTLIARALANECSQGERKVTFFMRKGADCLSKWVGESERQLRLLFEQAFQSRPSIIFFDEIDGLAPVRSAKQDQIHASIVSTLLALMDGLDDRGDIVVIGATNRIDAIDPALRRPGRFDRELLFPLPANKERQEILKIHVSKWEYPPSAVTLNHLAEMSVGYCGSDLRALCSEAVIQALRRRYPQIYKSSKKLLLNPDNVKVNKRDFDQAQRNIVPASYRSAPGFGRKLPLYLEPLLGSCVTDLVSHVKSVFPCGFLKANRSLRVVKSPKLLIMGQKKATSLVTAALLHRMEHCPVHTLDLATLYGETSRSPEEATIHVLNEVRRNIPSILYIPSITEWWSSVGATVRAVFKSLLYQLDPSLPILFLATAVIEVPKELQSLFSKYRSEVYRIKNPNVTQIEQFFRPLFFVITLKPPPPPRRKGPLEELPVAPPPSPPKLSEEQLKVIYDKEENTLRELRIFLRQICAKLARNKQFFMFSKPVDVKEVPDYLNIIKEPMDLETMMTKIDLHKYTCAQDFLNDVELICGNALEYNPDRDAADKLIRHRACYLRDTAYALIKAEMDSDFEDTCREIRAARKTRTNNVNKFAPEFVRAQDPNEIKKNALTENNSKDIASTTLCENPSNPTPASNNSNENILKNNVKTTVKSLIDSNELRRKRRRNPWSRGLITKKGKVKIADKSNSGGESHGNPGAEDLTIENSEVESTCLLRQKRRRSEQIGKDKVQIDTPSLPSPIKKRGRPIKSREKVDQSGEAVNKPVVNQLKEDDSVISMEISSELENVAQSTPLKKKRTTSETNNEVMVNGVDGMSSEDNDNDSQGNEKDESSQNEDPLAASDSSFMTENASNLRRTVILHKPSLHKLLAETVSVTKNITSFEILIDLYAQLRQIISRYLKVADRTALPQELELELKRFTKRCKEEEIVDMDESFQIHYNESTFT